MSNQTERLEMQGENLAEQVTFFEQRVSDLGTQKSALLTAVNAAIDTLSQSDNLDSHEYEIIQWALTILQKARADEAKAESAAAEENNKG